MSEYLGLILSFLFIFLAMGVASILLAKKILGANGARKLIHISVGHWWFIAMFTMDTLWVAMAGPVSFIIINFLLWKFRLVPAMETRGSNLGTVYYPVSLLVLVLAAWTGGMPRWVGGLGIMIMAWGDAWASLAGEALAGRGLELNFLGNKKSLYGSLVMLAISFALTLGMQYAFTGSMNPVPALVIGLLATAVELFTPYGLDNLSVPLASAFAYQFLFL